MSSAEDLVGDIETLGNRLAAHLPLPDYTRERHAAFLAGRNLQ